MKKRDISPIPPFLFTILRNRSLDYLKHVVITQNVHDTIKTSLNRELEVRINSLEACDPEVVFSNEVKTIMDDTLARLPEQTKKIFLMSRFYNKSHKEIAEEFDISVKGVDYHILQATKLLRVTLKDYIHAALFLLMMEM